MTEQRFYLLNYKNNVIYDSLEDNEYPTKYKKQKEELCNLLNDLHNKEPQKIEVIKELQPRYSDGTSAKWYYNTNNNITDGEEEYTTHRKEAVTYLDDTILHGTNDLLNRLNKYEKKVFQLEKENKELKKDFDSCSHNWALMYDEAKNKVEELSEENKQLKQQLSSINQLIDNKIDEFKNGDYGDLPCNTIHMFLDLKQELGDD